MVHTSLAQVVLLIGIVYKSQALPAGLGLCDGCPLKNGVGLTEFFGDCTKYVHCAEDAHGVVHGTVQPCAFGTEWNQDLLTCVSPSQSTCSAKRDECYDELDGTRRPGVGNCRGYWECEKGDSVPLCCPIGYYFNNMTYTCYLTDDDHECYDKCFNEDYTKSTTTPMPCINKRPVFKEPGVYEELIEGWGWIQRMCPTGLQYVQYDCDCTLRVIVEQKCEPDLSMSFTIGIEDQSADAQYILSENVAVHNGMALFNADMKSQLIIPRYTNVGMSTLAIHVKYFSEHESLTKKQAILSNSDCGLEPSILLTEDSNFIYFTVRTALGEFTLSVKQPLTIEKDIAFTYDSGILYGNVNGMEETMEVEVSGGIVRVHCALHVGSADENRGDYFTGAIDEITLSLCV